jgi:hypothetical protein
MMNVIGAFVEDQAEEALLLKMRTHLVERFAPISLHLRCTLGVRKFAVLYGYLALIVTFVIKTDLETGLAVFQVTQ